MKKQTKEKIEIKQEDSEIDFKLIKNIESVEVVDNKLIIHIELK